MTGESSNHNGSEKRLEIRKYPNRRYYDTTRSRHVTLEEINAVIREGYEIQVTDSKTGQDITAKVLAQIILDLDSPKLDVFPTALLHRLIRANEQLVTDFVDKYFNQALTRFLDSQRAFEQSFRSAIGLGTTAPGVPEWARLMWGPLAQPLFSTGQPRRSEAGPSPAEQPQGESKEDLRQTVDTLRHQVASLQQQLSHGKPKPKRRGR